MGSGDEMRLDFDAGALPPLPAGWRRDFLLLFDGWAKDGDANTAFSQSVEPLPFHGMSQLPVSGGRALPRRRAAPALARRDTDAAGATDPAAAGSAAARLSEGPQPTDCVWLAPPHTVLG